MQPNHLRDNPAKAKRTLVRGADGRLRPAGGDPEIADVWEQQRRLQLNQAINQRRQRDAQQKLRQERGLIGFAKLHVAGWLSRVRRLLFGIAATKPRPSNVRHQVTAQPAPPQTTPGATKNVEIVIAMPHLPSGFTKRLARGTLRLLASVKSTLRRRPRLTGLAALVIAASAGFLVWSPGSTTTEQTPRAGVQGTSTGRPAALQKGTPSYDTLLPAGKSIESLGGWTLISPPDRNPVYAYVDSIGGIRVSVSQQPLPADLSKDTARNIEALARGYDADQKFSVGDTTVHIGTSTQGPQSLIFSRGKLLILIKSVAPISDEQWVQYISSLR